MRYKISVPDSISRLIEKIEQAGYEAYIVGGCVRDSILGRTPNDWDVCTSALPQQLVEIFCECRVIQTGLQHGTLTVLWDNTSVEVTTFRIDGVYQDNRHPDSVQYTSDIYEDLSRRDFTMNAIAYSPSKDIIIDPYSGIETIKNGIIKCVGDPYIRFKEDALRILRAWRFSCQLQFDIEEGTKTVMLNNISLLDSISAERIRDEFLKALNSDGFKKNTLENDAFLLYILPEFKTMKMDQKNPYHVHTVYMHTFHALEAYEGNDQILRLAIILHDTGKPQCFTVDVNGNGHFKGHGKVSAELAKSILQRLKFDNATIERVVELVYYHDATFEVGEKYIKRWLNKIGEEQFKRLLDLRVADIMGQNPMYITERVMKIALIQELLDKILSEEACFSLKDLKVSGRDLIIRGYEQGVLLGRVLDKMLNRVIDGDLKNEKETLLEWAQEYMEEIESGKADKRGVKDG